MNTRFTMLSIPTLALLTTTLAAQNAAPDGARAGIDDPPARVARLSAADGTVSFRPGSVTDWTAARINYPLTTGDYLWADRDSRAEFTVGADAFRLGPSTAAELLNVNDHTTQIRLTQGSLEARVRSLDGDEVIEIDTPDGAVTILRTGAYRVDVTPDGVRSTVTVRRGAAEVSARNLAVQVNPGKSAVFTAVSGTDSVTYTLASAIPADAWESWCDQRDQRADEAAAARYVSTEMTGYEALDGYGSWEVDPTLGPVWIPVVPAGWAPYRFGSWVWEDPWGWTWVDDAPWGFAPFHYGRWLFWNSQWAWFPGPIVATPVYAPALVAFVGGSGWDVSLSFGAGGGIGWFPLAPGEPYIPAYRVSPAYLRAVNVVNERITNVDVTNIDLRNIHFANRSVPGAVTAVSRETFTSGGDIARAAVAVPARALDRATVVGMTAQVAPSMQSVLPRAASVGRPIAQPPAAALARATVAHLTPPPRPVDFSTEARALATAGGRPLSTRELQSLRAPAPQPAPSARPTDGVVRPAPRPAPAPETRPPAAPAARPLAATTMPARPSDEHDAVGAPSGEDALLERQRAEREQMAARQRAEVQRPPAGMPTEQLMWQHAQERRALEERQQQERQQQERQQQERQQQERASLERRAAVPSVAEHMPARGPERWP